MVSVLILTYNEEKNIKQCLESLIDFSDDIFILDSYSDDNTIRIANEYLQESNILFRKFDNYSDQRNWAMENINFKYEWLLMIDADEILTEEVKRSIKSELLNVDDNIIGFSVKLKMVFLGKQLMHYFWPLKRKSLYRYKEVAFNRDINEHIHGKSNERTIWKTLEGHLLHKDNKTLHDHFAKHNYYSTMEAFRIAEEYKEKMNWDKIYKMKEIKKLYYRLPFRKLLYFIYLFFVRLGFLNGKNGFIFILLRLMYQLEIDLKIKEIKEGNFKRENYISFRR